jgi:hypothetical protein
VAIQERGPLRELSLLAARAAEPCGLVLERMAREGRGSMVEFPRDELNDDGSTGAHMKIHTAGPNTRAEPI